MNDQTNIPGRENTYLNYNYGYDNPSPNTGAGFPSQPGTNGMNSGTNGAPMESGGTVVGGYVPQAQMSSMSSMPSMPSMPAGAEYNGGFRPNPNVGKPIYGFLFSVSRVPTGEFWPLYQGNNTIGRDPSCDICLPESTVSRQHMSFIIRKNRNPEKVVAAIRDNGSTAGTMLNGQSLDFDIVECCSGDIITVGQSYELLFIMVDAASYGLKPAQRFSPSAMPSQQAPVYPSAQSPMPQRDMVGNDYQVPPSFRPENAPVNPPMNAPMNAPVNTPVNAPMNSPRVTPSDGTVGMDGFGGIGRGGTMS